MKNLKVLFQKSILVFVIVFFAACEREVEQAFVPTSLPYESVKVYPQSENSTLPIVIPVDNLDKPANYKYLTLTDASLKNAIVIKIKTDDKALLSNINAETVQLIALSRFLPGVATSEKAQTDKILPRSALIPIEIEILETKFQKDVRLFGIKFVRPDLLKAFGSYEFTYKNSHVTAVHVVGKDGIKEISRFTVLSSECSDCGVQVLTPHYFAANNMISFYSNKPSSISLKANAKFSDELLILW